MYNILAVLLHPAAYILHLQDHSNATVYLLIGTNKTKETKTDSCGNACVIVRYTGQKHIKPH